MSDATYIQLVTADKNREMRQQASWLSHRLELPCLVLIVLVLAPLAALSWTLGKLAVLARVCEFGRSPPRSE